MTGAFRSRSYRLFWSGSFVSNVGLWMQSVAIGWLVYEMTHRASMLATISFCGNLPLLGLGLVGGAVADRASRRAAMLGTQVVLAAAAFALAALTAAGRIAIWHIIALAMVAGTASALYIPVMQAVIPSLVEPEDLLNAVSLNSVQFNLARALGPALTGLVYARMGAAGCFTMNAVSFLVLGLALSRIHLPRRPVVTSAPMGRALRDGIRYARAHAVIWPALLLATVISLFGFPYIVLMPALAHAIGVPGVAGLGYLMAPVGAGAVVGGLGLSAAGDLRRKGLVAALSALAFGLVLMALPVVHTARTGAGLLFVLGMLQVSCVATLNTTIQVAVDDAMRGRVMSMLTVILFGFVTIGSLILGTIGDWLGVPQTLAAGGVLVALAGATVSLRADALVAAAPTPARAAA